MRASDAELVLKLGALAHDLLRGLGIVPEVRVFGDGVQLGEAARRRYRQSKMPPQQPDGLLDLVGEASDFGAHG